MLTASVICFVIAAVSGLILAAMFVKAKHVKPTTALGHGIFAATGLILLLIATLQTGFVMLTGLSFALFVAAAIVGAAMFVYHLTKGLPQIQAIALHALCAVAGFVVLLIYFLSPK